MQLLSFNMFRTIGIKTEHAKSDYHFDSLKKIEQADVVLFPEYWQIHSIIYGMKKPIFPSAATFHLGHDKIEMTRIFQTVIPDNIPRTGIYGKNEFTVERVLREFSFPFVAKTVRSSMGQGVHLIKNETDWKKYTDTHETFYIQEYIPNEKDLRVVVVGDQVLAAYWRVGGAQFLNNVAQGGVLDFDDVPQGAIDFVLSSMSSSVGKVSITLVSTHRIRFLNMSNENMEVHEFFKMTSHLLRHRFIHYGMIVWKD